MPYLGVASPQSLMNKAQLHYEDRTLEQARTVVFLHDWPLNRLEWSYPVALFSRGYRTISVDLPGFGRSDDTGGVVSYDKLASDVGALAKVLNLSRIVLVGAGFGAGVALAYATRFPRTLAGLVLVGALAPRWTKATDFPHGIPRDDLDHLLEQSETNWPDLLATFVESMFHTAVGESTRQWFMAMGFEASLYMVQQCLMVLRDSDLRDELAQVQVPTAVFHGVHDRIAPIGLGEYLAQNIPNASLVRFEHSGHAVWVDEKLRFNTELTGFIEEKVFGDRVPPAGTEKLPGGGERLPFKEIASRSRRGAPKLEGDTGQVYEG